jgi:hypothetical protein
MVRTRRTGGSRSSPIVVAARRTSVQPTRLELALLDPQVARKLGIVAANHLDEPLGVVAAD